MAKHGGHTARKQSQRVSGSSSRTKKWCARIGKDTERISKQTCFSLFFYISSFSVNVFIFTFFLGHEIAIWPSSFIIYVYCAECECDDICSNRTHIMIMLMNAQKYSTATTAKHNNPLIACGIVPRMCVCVYLRWLFATSDGTFIFCGFFALSFSLFFPHSYHFLPLGIRAIACRIIKKKRFFLINRIHIQWARVCASVCVCNYKCLKFSHRLNHAHMRSNTRIPSTQFHLVNEWKFLKFALPFLSMIYHYSGGGNSHTHIHTATAVAFKASGRFTIIWKEAIHITKIHKMFNSKISKWIPFGNGSRRKTRWLQ